MNMQGHICQCLSRISTVRCNRTVTIFGDRRKTGIEFVESVRKLASGLSEIGVRSGDVVAIAALNSDLYLEWLLAIAFVGGIAAPLNYRWNFEEARSAMEVVGPVMLVVDESCHTWYSQLQHNKLHSIRWHVFIGDPPPSLIRTDDVFTTEALKRPLQLISPSFDYCWAPDGIALICFTSGTTGRPKGVAISHTSLIVQSLAKIAIVGYSEDDVYLHTAPLCHIGGISSGMTMLMVGACHVLIPKFESHSALNAIQHHHVSSLITVPTMMVDLISLIRKGEGIRWRGGESMKKILNGGGGLSVELIRDTTTIFPTAKLLSAYGMTETCSSLTFMTLYDPANENHSESNRRVESESTRREGVCVGKPAPHVELQIIGEGTSSSIGRILTRGPHVMIKYWDQNLVASGQGWIDTGDLGWIDHSGELWLVGRSKDRIKSGGENVHPEEVEAVLSKHPGISSILVVGIPNARLSEMVIGCVRIRENWKWIDENSNSNRLPEKGEAILTTEILQKYCKRLNLSRFKIPKIFLLWRKTFPVTSTGKVRRTEVRREAISKLQLLLPSYL